MIGAVLFPLFALFLLASFYALVDPRTGKHTRRYARTHKPYEDPPRSVNVTGEW